MNGVTSGEKDALEFAPGGFVGHTSGMQRHEFEPDTEGTTFRVSMRTRRDGSIIWKTVGQPTSSPGGTAYFGTRREHYDFNF